MTKGRCEYLYREDDAGTACRRSAEVKIEGMYFCEEHSADAALDGELNPTPWEYMMFLFSRRTRQSMAHEGRGLYLILKEFESELEDSFNALVKEYNGDYESVGYSFHKSFRQVDMIDCREGFMDMVVWNLLYDCELWWKCLEKSLKKYEKNTDGADSATDNDSDELHTAASHED